MTPARAVLTTLPPDQHPAQNAALPAACALARHRHRWPASRGTIAPRLPVRHVAGHMRRHTLPFAGSDTEGGALMKVVADGLATHPDLRKECLDQMPAGAHHPDMIMSLTGDKDQVNEMFQGIRGRDGPRIRLPREGSMA